MIRVFRVHGDAFRFDEFSNGIHGSHAQGISTLFRLVFRIFKDDILIYSQSEDYLRIVLQALKEHQLYSKFSKCEFWLTEVRFLGHVVSILGVSMNQGKVEVVMSWERPKSAFKIRSFLRLAGYYRRFIEDFSD